MSEEIATAIGDIVYAQQLRERIDQLEADNAALREALHSYINGPEPFAKVRAIFQADNPGARYTALLSAARAYRDAWAGCSFAMGPLAIGVRWDRLEKAIAALDEKE